MIMHAPIQEFSLYSWSSEGFSSFTRQKFTTDLLVKSEPVTLKTLIQSPYNESECTPGVCHCDVELI